MGIIKRKSYTKRKTASDIYNFWINYKVEIAFICLFGVVGCLLSIQNNQKDATISIQQRIITTQRKEITNLESKIKKIEERIQKAEIQQQSSSIRSQEPQLQSLGIFEITAYCPCSECSSSWNRTTSTGTTATANRTIGVNPNVIPYGSKVMINGQEYIAEDTGGAALDNPYWIDIFMNTHDECIQFGRQHIEVFIVR